MQNLGRCCEYCDLSNRAHDVLRVVLRTGLLMKEVSTKPTKAHNLTNYARDVLGPDSSLSN